MHRDATNGREFPGKSVKNLPFEKLKFKASAIAPAAPPAIASRTMLAFALGFVCVSLTVYATDGDINRAIARDDAGMHEFLAQNARGRKPFYIAPVFYTPQYRAPAVYQPQRLINRAPAAEPKNIVRSRPIRSFANLPHNIAPLRQKSSNQPRDLAGATGAVTEAVDASGLPRRSYCVRLCDGYYFPVAPVNSDGDLNAHESLCAGLCPGAPTRLFIMPSGSERIEEAASRDGRKYSALPVAFRHTGTTDNTCACRPDNIAHTKIVSVMRDFTLRQGDMVMSNKGFRVFRGASHYPYGQSDFLSLAESSVNAKNRAALSAIEYATRQARIPERTTQRGEKTALAVAPKAIAPDETMVQSNGKRIRRIGPEVYVGE